MQPVDQKQLSLLELTLKVEELTKKIETLTIVQTEPVKIVFASFIHDTRRCTETRITNVTKKLSREMLVNTVLFYKFLNLEFWQTHFQSFGEKQVKEYQEHFELQKNLIEGFFKDLNVPCNIVIFEGSMEDYLKQF